MSGLIKEGSLTCYFDEKHILKLFPEFLSICKYNSGKKTACYQTFKNGHFVRACMEKMMNHQYKEHSAINIFKV